MITVFNRREITVTRDLYALVDILNELLHKNINYVTQINCVWASTEKYHNAAPNVIVEPFNEYRVFVSRKDFEKAMLVIGKTKSCI